MNSFILVGYESVKELNTYLREWWNLVREIDIEEDYLKRGQIVNSYDNNGIFVHKVIQI